MLPPFLPPLGKVSYLPLGRSRRPWTPATRRSPEPSSRFPLPNCRPKRVFFRGAGAVFSFLGFFPARGTAGARGNDLPEVGVKSFKERVCVCDKKKVHAAAPHHAPAYPSSLKASPSSILVSTPLAYPFFFLNPLSGVGTQPCGKIPQRNPRSPPKASVGFPQRPLVHAGPRQTPSQSTFGQRPGGAAPPRPLAGIFRA